LNTSFYFGILNIVEVVAVEYLIIIGIILIIITTIILMILNSKNKFNLLNIKIKESESNIDLFLQKKKNILQRIIKIILEDEKYKDYFTEFEEDISKKNNNFQFHSLLNKYYMQVSKIIFDDDKVATLDKVVELLSELKDNEEDLIGSIKFYNDTVVDYNGLIKTFPHNLFSIIVGYKEKEFYSNEKEEMFQILK